MAVITRSVSLKAVASLAGLAAWLGGCAADSEPEPALKMMEQPFGVASCGEATADTLLQYPTGSGGGPSVMIGGTNPNGAGGTVSSADYDTCFRGYVIDIPNLSPIYAGLKTTPGGRDGRIVTRWRGPALDTQKKCEDAWSGAIVYKKVNGAWVDQAGVVSTFGRWSESASPHCVPPEFSSDVSGVVLESSASYRLAATMRPRYGSSILYTIGYGTVAPN